MSCRTSAGPRARRLSARLAVTAAGALQAVGLTGFALLINQDLEADGALGDTGIPTFFINGRPITLQRTIDVENAITAALD